MTPKSSLAKKSVVLLSGGMDSLLITAMCHQRGDQLAALHVNYGQRTEKKELECFHAIADHYKIPHTQRNVVDLTFLGRLGGSALTDKNLLISPTLQQQDTIPNTYVPFRNTIMLSVACAWAEILGFDQLVIGAVEDDSPGYPDCRPSYYEAFNKLISAGTKEGRISIETPIIAMNKLAIVKKCYELNAPLDLSWSCYQSQDTPCGQCDSCLLRNDAITKANATLQDD